MTDFVVMAKLGFVGLAFREDLSEEMLQELMIEISRNGDVYVAVDKKLFDEWAKKHEWKE